MTRCFLLMLVSVVSAFSCGAPVDLSGRYMGLATSSDCADINGQLLTALVVKTAGDASSRNYNVSLAVLARAFGPDSMHQAVLIEPIAKNSTSSISLNQAIGELDLSYRNANCSISGVLTHVTATDGGTGSRDGD